MAKRVRKVYLQVFLGSVRLPGGKTCSITSEMQCKALQLMVMTPGKPVSYDTFLRGIWGTSVHREWNSVQQIIGQLRKIPELKKRIHTHRRVGYSIDIAVDECDLLQLMGRIEQAERLELAGRFAEAGRVISKWALEVPGRAFIASDHRIEEVVRRALVVEAKVSHRLHGDIAKAAVLAKAESFGQLVHQRVAEAVEVYTGQSRGVIDLAGGAHRGSRRNSRGPSEDSPQVAAEKFARLALDHYWAYYTGGDLHGARSLQIAEDFAQQALAIDKTCPLALQVHLLVLCDQGSHEQMALEAVAAVRAQPQMLRLWVALAGCLKDAGMSSEALEILDAVIR